MKNSQNKLKNGVFCRIHSSNLLLVYSVTIPYIYLILALYFKTNFETETCLLIPSKSESIPNYTVIIEK